MCVLINLDILIWEYQALSTSISARKTSLPLLAMTGSYHSAHNGPEPWSCIRSGLSIPDLPFGLSIRIYKASTTPPTQCCPARCIVTSDCGYPARKAPSRRWLVKIWALHRLKSFGVWSLESGEQVYAEQLCGAWRWRWRWRWRCLARVGK